LVNALAPKPVTNWMKISEYPQHAQQSGS